MSIVQIGNRQCGEGGSVIYFKFLVDVMQVNFDRSRSKIKLLAYPLV